MTTGPDHAPRTAAETVDWLQRRADPVVRGEMGDRYGIHTDRALGIPMKDMKALERRIGTDHALAADLWRTGWYEARIVAALIDEPALVTADQMDAWVNDFDNWAIVDTVCFNLFDRTAHAWDKVDQWATNDAEFVQRAALALLWALALHDRTAPDTSFRQRLTSVEHAAHDPRHLVHKAAAMALRAISTQRPVLRDDVRATAQRLVDSGSTPARGIGRRALREA